MSSATKRAPRGMTRAEALDYLVGLDVERWGDGEREASWRMHCRTSHALLLNSIAYRDPEAPDTDLAAEARALMTAADLRVLGEGG